MSFFKRIIAVGARVSRKLARERAQTLPEYALLLGVLAVSVVTAMLFMSDQVKLLFTGVGRLL